MHSHATITKKQRLGFTLVELLLVISIISLLASIILASLGTTRSKATNARKALQVMEFAKSLALYQSNHNGIYAPDFYINLLSNPFRDTVCPSVANPSAAYCTLQIQMSTNAETDPNYLGTGNITNTIQGFLGTNFVYDSNLKIQTVGPESTYACLTQGGENCSAALITLVLEGNGAICPRPANAILIGNRALHSNGLEQTGCFILLH